MASEREQIERAIAAVEAQRPILGDGATDAALDGLQERLAALRAQASGIEQRKLITVLFAEVLGTAALAESLDAEDVTEVMNTIWKHLDAVIREQGGVIDKHIGSVVMAVWGAEAAREDDPERAIHAALMLQRELDLYLQTRRGAPLPSLQLRSGLNTGLALLGEVGTTGEFTAMGDTVNVASRLQNAAAPGALLISYDTYRHVRGVFDVTGQETIQVKGKSEPLEIFRVRGVKPRAFRIGTRGVEGIETRMVGRDAELAQLQSAFHEVMTSRKARVVTIVGDAGVGKSRLIHEFHKWLELLKEQVWFFRGRASEPMINVPFSLIHDVLAFRFEIQENDSMAAARNKLEQGVARFIDTDAEEKAHFIGQLLGIDFSASPYISGVLSDPAQIRARAFHYVGQLFRAVATFDSSPAVLFLEDVHWADDGSLALAEHVAQACLDVPLLAVCIARPTLYERHQSWGADPALHLRIDLKSLARSDCQRLVEDILRKAGTIPEVLCELIVSRAEGNPYYVEELIKMLIDDGVIVARADEWRIAPGRLVEARVPATLTGVIQARLDSLPPEEKLALQKAAVVGRIFWDRAVEQIGGNGHRSATPLLSALVSRELVFEREASSFAGSKEYIFKHTILHEVTYESVLKKLRRIYHAQVAAWLEQQRGERVGEHVGLIANHYERAEDAGKALEYLNGAGEQALTMGANREAITLFDRALALASGDYAASLINARPWQALLKAQLGRAHTAMSDYETATRLNRESLALAREIHDSAGIARALNDLGTLAHRVGDFEGARRYIEECLKIYREIDDEAGIIDALYLLGDVAFSESKFDDSGQHFEEALALAREIGDRTREAAVMTSYALVPWGKGDPAGAMPRLEECLQILRQVGDRAKIANTYNSIGGVAYLIGDYPKAWDNYTHSLKISEEIGDRNGVGRALVNLGELAYDMGNLEESEQFTRRGMKESLAIKSIPRVLYALYSLARLRARQGEKKLAAEWMGLALNHTSTRSDLKLSCERFMQSLETDLGSKAYKSAIKRGEKLDLENIARDLLAE